MSCLKKKARKHDIPSKAPNGPMMLILVVVNSFRTQTRNPPTWMAPIAHSFFTGKAEAMVAEAEAVVVKGLAVVEEVKVLGEVCESLSSLAQNSRRCILRPPWRSSSTITKKLSSSH